MKFEKVAFTTVLLIFLLHQNIYSQSRIISGKVIDENMVELSHVLVLSNDSIELGKSNHEGVFKVEVPDSAKTIKLWFLGMESAIIEFEDGCDRIEVVMLLSSTYDFISLKRADRKRKRKHKILPDLHKQAFDKGMFKAEHTCYRRCFEPLYKDKNR